MKVSELLDKTEPGIIGELNTTIMEKPMEYEKFIEHITDMSMHVSRADRLRANYGTDNIGTAYVSPPQSGTAQSRISQAIADAANLGKDVCEVVLSEGIYEVDTSVFGTNILRLTAGRNVILRGENAVLRLVDTAVSTVIYNLLDGTVISNLTIEGNENATGLHLRGDNVIIEGVKIYNCGTGILVDGDGCVIENSLIKGCTKPINEMPWCKPHTEKNVEVLI